MFDPWYPWPIVAGNSKSIGHSGFKEMRRDWERYSYMWFKLRGSVFGGLYLPSNMEMDTCIECVLSATDLVAGSGNEGPVFLAGYLKCG